MTVVRKKCPHCWRPARFHLSQKQYDELQRMKTALACPFNDCGRRVIFRLMDDDSISAERLDDESALSDGLSGSAPAADAGQPAADDEPAPPPWADSPGGGAGVQDDAPFAPLTPDEIERRKREQTMSRRFGVWYARLSGTGKAMFWIGFTIVVAALFAGIQMI